MPRSVTTKNKRLTPKQEAFVLAYLANGRNAVAAYRAAYNTTNMASRTVEIEAQRVVVHPIIALRIQEVVNRVALRTEITIEKIEREYARIAFADIRNVVKWRNEVRKSDDGKTLESSILLKPSDEIDDDVAATISEVSNTAQGVKIKLHDKLGALNDLAKIKGMFIEKRELTVNVGDDPATQEMLRYIHEQLTHGPLARPGGHMRVIDQPPAVPQSKGKV